MMCLDTDKEKKLRENLEQERKTATTFILYSIAVLIPPVFILKIGHEYYSVTGVILLVAVTVSVELLLIMRVVEKKVKIARAEKLFWNYKRSPDGIEKKKALNRLLAFIRVYFKNILDKE